MTRNVSTNRHICSEKKNDLNNVSVRKIETEKGWTWNQAGRTTTTRAWGEGETDLAWHRSSSFHKSGVPLRAQTHLRDSTI